MEKICKWCFTLVLSLMLLGATAKSVNENFPVIEKTKIFEKSFDLSASDKVSIHNKFGKVVLTTWDQNSIKVKVTITVGAKSEERAVDMLEDINIKASKTENLVQYRTDIDGNGGNNWHGGSGKTSMKIDYEVQMPKSQTFKLTNEFGPITMPDYTGALTVVSKFGSITAGKILNTEKILVEFGNADIKGLTCLDATFKFSKINILSLEGSNELEYEFCKAARLGLNSNLTKLMLKESYSKVYIQPATSLNATFSIRTSFGSATSRISGLGLTEIEEDDYGQNKEYELKMGTGETKIKIKSSFGKVIFGEPSAKEIEADRKEDEKEDKKKGNDDDWD